MTPRRCSEAGCDTILSRYNPHPKCGAHLEADRVALLEEQAENTRRVEARERARAALIAAQGDVTAPADGTLRSRILDALPGTAAEVSAAIGEPTRRVSRILASLLNAGLATGEGPRGAGTGTERRVYRRAKRQDRAA